MLAGPTQRSATLRGRSDRSGHRGPPGLADPGTHPDPTRPSGHRHLRRRRLATPTPEAWKVAAEHLASTTYASDWTGRMTLDATLRIGDRDPITWTLSVARAGTNEWSKRRVVTPLTGPMVRETVVLARSVWERENGGEWLRRDRGFGDQPTDPLFGVPDAAWPHLDAHVQGGRPGPPRVRADRRQRSAGAGVPPGRERDGTRANRRDRGHRCRRRPDPGQYHVGGWHARRQGEADGRPGVEGGRRDLHASSRPRTEIRWSTDAAMSGSISVRAVCVWVPLAPRAANTLEHP